MDMTVRADRRFIRATYRSNRFVLVDIVAPESARAPSREPLDIAFVLDRSGSMAGRKIALAREAVGASIGALGVDDRFAVVAYDDRIDIVAPVTRATTAARADATRALAGVDARGSTNLFEGWMRGCEQVATAGVERSLRRVLLMSDGLANVGVTDHAELVSHAGELWRRGVATWTFGFGADFDEELLDRMAVAGGGQSFYVETPEQIRDDVTSAVGEALDVVARDVEIRVRTPEGVIVEPLGLFRSRSTSGLTVIEVGDLVSRQTLRVVLRVNFPFGAIGSEAAIELWLAERDAPEPDRARTLSWVYADGRTNDLQPRDREADREVARLFAARARTEAAEHNRKGAYKQARAVLEATAGRIAAYAGDDPELREIVARLEGEGRIVEAPMAAAQVKQMHYQSSYAQRGRDAMGRAWKDPSPRGG
jgi:Ca-activated chloride channel family protein